MSPTAPPAVDLARCLAPLDPPATLSALAAYQDSGRFVPGLDLLADGRYVIERWAASDARMIEALWPFGCDDAHGLFAFWTHATRDLTQAPVVYLDSEGCGNAVVAGNLDELVSLLCTGQRLRGQPIADDDPDLLRFRRWVDDELHLPIDLAADLIEARARAAHPDVDAWLFPEQAPA